MTAMGFLLSSLFPRSRVHFSFVAFPVDAYRATLFSFLLTFLVKSYASAFKYRITAIPPTPTWRRPFVVFTISPHDSEIISGDMKLLCARIIIRVILRLLLVGSHFTYYGRIWILFSHILTLTFAVYSLSRTKQHQFNQNITNKKYCGIFYFMF